MAGVDWCCNLTLPVWLVLLCLLCSVSSCVPGVLFPLFCISYIYFSFTKITTGACPTVFSLKKKKSRRKLQFKFQENRSRWQRKHRSPSAEPPHISIAENLPPTLILSNPQNQCCYQPSWPSALALGSMFSINKDMTMVMLVIIVRKRSAIVLTNFLVIVPQIFSPHFEEPPETWWQQML